MLICPVCGSELYLSIESCRCTKCGATYPIRDKIVELIPNSGEIPEGGGEENEYFFPEEGFDKLFQSEEDNFWFRARNKVIYTFFQQFTLDTDKILEIGCGTGYVSKFLKSTGYNLDCSDLFRSALTYCKKRDAGNHYYCYNLYNRVFQEEYDTVCAFDVLEHLDNDMIVFENIYESLKVNGKLIITVPACLFFWSSIDEHAGHKRRYNPDVLKQKLEQSGFRVERMSYFMFTLLPLYTASRFKVKLSERNSDKEENNCTSGTINYELNPPRVINKLLFRILFTEIILLKYINMPFGSSLICVATKKS